MQEQKEPLPRNHSSAASCLDAISLGKHMLLGMLWGYFHMAFPQHQPSADPNIQRGKENKKPRAGAGMHEEGTEIWQG